MATSLTPLTDKGLLALPPEVREMIFVAAFAGVWKRENRTPCFLKALRAHPTLYAEALAVFSKTNEYKLCGANRKRVQSEPV